MFQEEPGALLAWARAQAHAFSRLSDAYDAGGVDKLVDGFQPRASGRRLGLAALERWCKEDASTRELSPFDAALRVIASRPVAVCGEEVLWIEEGRWTAATPGALDLYMNFSQERRDAYGANVARNVHQKLLAAACSEEGRRHVHMRSAFFKEDVGDRGVGQLAWCDGVWDFAARRLDPVTAQNAGLSAVTRAFPARCPEKEATVRRFMAQIFPQAGERAAFLHAAARALAGHVADQRLMALVGATSNGKTSLRNFFVRALPGVVGVFNAAHLASTRADDPDRANTWLLPCEGMRLCFSDELTTASLNGGRLKAVTMGDIETLGVRRLYAEGSTVVVTAALCLLLNSMPQVLPADAAVAKRLHTWEMRSTFVEPEDGRISRPGFLPIDRDLSRNLRRDEGLHGALFWVLADAYSDTPSFDNIRCASVEALEQAMDSTRHDHMVAELFERADDEFLFNASILRALRDRHPAVSWNSAQVWAALQGLGALRSSGMRLNRETGRMDRFHTRIRIRSPAMY